MANKQTFTDEDDALLAELGVEVEAKKAPQRTAREERIIAGFGEIERFVDEHGRAPEHGENKDIFERLYAVRLDKMRGSTECRDALNGLDHKGLLDGAPASDDLNEDIDDDALLDELGAEIKGKDDITRLTHVKTRAERKVAEEVANRTPCENFDIYKPLFANIQKELDNGIRQARPFKNDAQINKGDWFILSGQKSYIAEEGEEFVTDYDKKDRRLRVIFDNGTEISMLKRSLERALQKDKAGRRITNPEAGPLFSGERGEGDLASGTIYVLRSKSDHPIVKEHRDIVHKIGVTGGDVKKRIANAKLDATFLLADVEIVATYELYNINRQKLEKIIHRIFGHAKLDIEIKDRFGQPVIPREWFLVPLFIIDELVDKIREGTIGKYVYDIERAALVLRDDINA